MTNKRGSSKAAASEAARQPMTYRDFNLRFGAYDESRSTFKVWVEGEAPGGAMRPDDAAQCTYHPNTFWDNPSAGAGGPVGRLDRRQHTRADLFALGQALADLCLPVGQVRRLFEASLDRLKPGEGLRLRLRIDSAVLAQLPWEFMALPRSAGEPKAADFLALRHEISIVRTDTVEARSLDLPDRAVSRVVGVLASPVDPLRRLEPLDVDQERKVLQRATDALNQAAKREVVEVAWAERPTTRGALETVLEPGADIFHFAGHGAFEVSINGQEGKIFLENDDRTSDAYGGEQLGQRLRSAGVRLAVLGACETGRRDSHAMWSGVAGALTREKVPAVIANQFKIRNSSALILATRLYHRALAGFTVDEALADAREAIYQSRTEGLELRDWGMPVLYLQADTGRLFPRPADEGQRDATITPQTAQSAFVRVFSDIDEVDDDAIGAIIRKQTGGRVQVVNKVGVVRKKFIGTQVGTLAAGSLDVKNKVKKVSGKFIGAKIDTIG